MFIKNGIQNRSVTAEMRNEKLNASSENSAFFSETAETAEKTADIKASKNQFIFTILYFYNRYVEPLRGSLICREYFNYKY